MAKELTREQKEREITKCKLRVQSKMPFWGGFIYQGGGVVYKTVEDAAKDGWKYGATDGNTVWLTDDVLAYPTKNQDYILVHELVHVQNCHCIRHKMVKKVGSFAGLPYREEPYVNAVEAWTNAVTLATGIGAPPADAGFFDPKVTYKDSIADIYRRYYEEDKQKEQDDEGGDQPCDGGKGGPGQGKPGKPEQFDTLLDPDPGEGVTADDIERAETNANLMTKAAIEAMKIAGREPGDLERWMQEQAEPKVDWREELHSLFRPWMGRSKKDFTRLNRNVFLRTNGMVLSPSRRGEQMGQLVFVCDTSGSIGQRELDVFLNDLVGILQDVKPKEVIVTGIDARMPAKWVTLERVEDMPLAMPAIRGGGGTDFRVFTKWIEKEGFRPDAVIYYTDAYGPFDREAPDYPVYWAVTSDQKVPWGERVQVDID